MFNEIEEHKGAVLVAAGISPYVLRMLAKKADGLSKLSGPTVAIAILKLRVNDPALEALRKATEDGRYSKEDRLAVEREVDWMIARYKGFEATTQTEEEFSKLWGEENTDWVWRDTPFGRARVKIK